MNSSSDETVGLDASVLAKAGRRLEEDVPDADLDEGRRNFLEGLRSLESGEVTEAIGQFRRASRTAVSPFDALARVARAECERVRGRVGVALREWREVADTEDAPPAVRYVAWLSIAAAARDRSNRRLLERARDAIDRLETSEEV